MTFGLHLALNCPAALSHPLIPKSRLLRLEVNGFRIRR